MVEELPERRAGARASGLLPVDSVERLVHEATEAGVEDRPLGHRLGQRQVVVEVDRGR